MKIEEVASTTKSARVASHSLPGKTSRAPSRLLAGSHLSRGGNMIAGARFRFIILLVYLLLGIWHREFHGLRAGGASRRGTWGAFSDTLTNPVRTLCAYLCSSGPLE
ncbi:unnamed protein product [Amoebophrya sp. A120]|nr:unnamed protein product [Amoebophrya sp. A120]|eukprot:GSA120T00003692001.1